MHIVEGKKSEPAQPVKARPANGTIELPDNRGETLIQQKLITRIQRSNQGVRSKQLGKNVNREILQRKSLSTKVIQRVAGESDLEGRAKTFLKNYKTVSPSALKSADPEIDNPIIALFTGPITNLAAHGAEVASSKMPQHLKALVPWSHKRKNWMRAVSALEGATDIAFNGAALGADAMTIGAASSGTAAIGAGYKTGFSGIKSWVRREHPGRAATKATSVATSEFAQGMIPYAGSAFGITAGAKELVETGDLDAIAPERKGERAVLSILRSRIATCRTLLQDALRASPDMDLATAFQESATVLSPSSQIGQEFEDTTVSVPDLVSIEGQFQHNSAPIGPLLISEKTTDKLREALIWLLRQEEKSIRRFKRIDEKER